MRLCLFLAVTLSLLMKCSASQEEKDHTWKSVKLGNQKTLQCGEAEQHKSVTWSFTAEGQNDSAPVSVGEHFTTEANKLVILDVQQEDLGIYRCFDEENEEVESFIVDISLKLRKLPKSISIDEGSSTEQDMKCSMISSGQEVVFKWFTRPEAETNKDLMTPLCSKTSVSDCNIPDPMALFDKKDKLAPVVPLAERSEITLGVEDDIPFSVLTIKDTDKSDRMVFICKATLKDMEVNNCTASKHCDMSETILRVKDPLAALWPFCGIVIEVILLCIIIFFCEKRKSSQEKEDYDEGSNGNSVATGRHRK